MILNSHTRIFLQRPGRAHAYFSAAGVFRITVADEQARLILCQRIVRQEPPDDYSILHLTDGCGIDVAMAESGDPSIYREEDVVARFLGCIVRRSWIPDMGALSPKDVKALTAYVELWTYVYHINLS